MIPSIRKSPSSTRSVGACVPRNGAWSWTPCSRQSGPSWEEMASAGGSVPEIRKASSCWIFWSRSSTVRHGGFKNRVAPKRGGICIMYIYIWLYVYMCMIYIYMISYIYIYIYHFFSNAVFAKYLPRSKNEVVHCWQTASWGHHPGHLGPSRADPKVF